MRATLFLCWLAFSATASFAQAEPASDNVEGPLKLTESQMDAVSAGALYVLAEAEASAVGEGGFTYTGTETHTHSGQHVETGFGRAKALACCGAETAADVSLEGGADGMIVKEVNKRVVIQTPSYSIALGWIIVISINPPSLEPFSRSF
jgi:hypothetical protein